MSSTTATENANESGKQIAFARQPEGCGLVAVPPPLTKRQAAGPAALSFAQERLWFLDQINPGDRSANLSRAVHLKGLLNLEALEQGFGALVTRHEILRTTFARREHYAATDGRPAQLISETGTIDFAVIDLTGDQEADRTKNAKAVARAEAQKPFDLTLGPLLRLRLLRISEVDHILLLCTHRIIADEASLDIFFGELLDHYHAALKGEPLSRPLLPIQFADYANWQRDWLQGEALEAQLDYWKSRLAGVPSVGEMPADRARPAMQSWHGSSCSLSIEQDLTRQLRAVAEQDDATLSEIALTAFQVLIARYSGQSDIVIGSTITDREREETRFLIGPISNPVVQRADLSGSPNFSQLLRRAKMKGHEQRAFQSLPFASLLEGLQLERSLSHAPIFQILFNFKREEADRGAQTRTGGPLPESFEFDSGISQYDLTLAVSETDERLDCRLEYNSDLYDAATAERILGHYKQVLATVAQDSTLPIDQIELLTASERHRILVEWNDTQRPVGAESFVELFETQVKRTPDATAVTFESNSLSYSELNARANQLAHYLKRRKVGPEAIVAIFVPRSIEMVIGTLGVLKAGGAYLPLEASYPAERLAFMLEDAGVSVVLAHSGLEGTSPGSSAEIIWLDRQWPTISAESRADPNLRARADNLVYVIYTSGSTGKPKGVMVTQKGLVNYLSWCTKAYRIENGAGSVVHSPLAFDLTVTSLLAPLVCGQRVILLAEEPGIEGLAATINRNGDFSLLKITPSHLESLAYALHSDQAAKSARALIVGGESLLAETVQFWREAAPETSIVNEYGPTETVVGCCVHTISSADPPVGPVAIGRPIANTQIYLLDDNLRPVPVGVPGEVYIGGVGVARGYLNRPDLTAERFLPNPFGSNSANSGSRLYRTGDRARYLADGKIQFLGRLDDQVKIRGHRIELKEIESALAQFPEVKECAVILSNRSDRGAEIVAYMKLDDGRQPTVEELKELLAKKLPAYMLPSAFITVDKIPLTANGKLDQRALPQVDHSRSGGRANYVAPRDQIEEHLAKLWQKVLDVEQIGIRDNFFDLGGHSILATRLFAQIENRFGRKLPLAALFQAPTIEQLGQLLRGTASSQQWPSLVALQPLGARPPLFCVHAGGANVLIYRPLARHLGTEQPVYALQAQGLDGQTKPLRRIEDMAKHYVKEIRNLQPHGPYQLLGASFGGLVVFEMAQQLLRQGEAVALLAMLNTHCSSYTRLQRLRCHFGHVRQKGLRKYSSGLFRSIRVKSSPGVKSDGANNAESELQKILETREDKDDPLIKTVFGIVEASETYVPAEIYPGKIIYFWANDAASDFEDNRIGWRRFAAGGFDLHVVPGDHGTMREEPNVAVLVEKLRPYLG